MKVSLDQAMELAISHNHAWRLNEARLIRVRRRKLRRICGRILQSPGTRNSFLFSAQAISLRHISKITRNSILELAICLNAGRNDNTGCRPRRTKRAWCVRK